MKRRDKIFCAIFLSPATIMYMLFVMLPVILSVYYSFTRWDGVSPKVFIGLSNYREIFSDPDFWTALKNNLSLIASSLMIQVTLGLIFAYLLYTGIKGFKVLRTIYFIPVVIAPIAIGVMFSLFYNSEAGLFNKLLQALGLEMLQRQWLSDTNVVLKSVMLPQVWQYIGLNMIIFLAALQSLPESVIESAKIDGASSMKIFTRIVIPMIWDVILIAVILCVTGGFKAFEHSWIMTQGGPGVNSAYLGVIMFNYAFVASDLGIGSSISIIIVICALLFTVISNKIFASKES